MVSNVKYQLFIGVNDSQSHGEVVGEEELKQMIVSYFERKKMDFSLTSLKGGYLHKNGDFIIENTICITIIGGSELNITKLGKSLSMYMNQEAVLITRRPLEMQFR